MIQLLFFPLSPCARRVNHSHARDWRSWRWKCRVLLRRNKCIYFHFVRALVFERKIWRCDKYIIVPVLNRAATALACAHAFAKQSTERKKFPLSMLVGMEFYTFSFACIEWQRIESIPVRTIQMLYCEFYFAKTHFTVAAPAPLALWLRLRLHCSATGSTVCVCLFDVCIIAPSPFIRFECNRVYFKVSKVFTHYIGYIWVLLVRMVCRRCWFKCKAITTLYRYPVSAWRRDILLLIQTLWWNYHMRHSVSRLMFPQIIFNANFPRCLPIPNKWMKSQ